jgi:hypothetical protein
MKASSIKHSLAGTKREDVVAPPAEAAPINNSDSENIMNRIVDWEEDHDSKEDEMSVSLKSAGTDGASDSERHPNNDTTNQNHPSNNNKQGPQNKKKNKNKNHAELTKDEKEEAILLASNESRQLCWTRGIVMVALILATFLVATVIYYSTLQSEVDQFETQLGDHSTKILTAVEDHLREAIGALDNLGITITSHGKSMSMSSSSTSSSSSSSTSWPFAVLPDFEVRAASTRNWASAGFLAFLPTVSQDQRKEWEQFSTLDSSTEWITTGLKYDKKMEIRSTTTEAFSTTTSSRSSGTAASIYKMDPSGEVEMVEDGPGPYYPIWQHSPIQTELVNFNMLSHPQVQEEVRLAIESQQIVLGRVSDHSWGSNSSSHDDDQGSDDGGLLLDRHDHRMDRVLHRPGSTLFLPVFVEFDTLSRDDLQPQRRDMIGLLLAHIDWSIYLNFGNLPVTAAGMQCVLASSCGEAYTFEVQRQQEGDDEGTTRMVFVGEGDQHDTFFDDLEEMIDVETVLLMDHTHAYNNHKLTTDGDGNNRKSNNSNNRLSYSGVTLNEDYCSFSVHIFPTMSMQKQYFTKKPIIYTSLVVVVFLFASLAFFAYDMLVERRQAVVISTAKKSHKIVARYVFGFRRRGATIYPSYHS